MREETSLHVYPVNDIKVHKTEGSDCECKPKIGVGEYDAVLGLTYYYRTKIIIHNAWDGRK